MATLKLLTTNPPESAAGQPAHELDPSCTWTEELRDAGVETAYPWVFSHGVPLLALGVLAAAGVAAALDASGLTIPAAALLLLAAIPWLLWIVRGDDGPSWPFLIAALAPVALLGFGHWFSDTVGPGSEAAALILAFPSLLLVMLGVVFAPSRLAVGMTVGAYLAYVAPLAAAFAAGRELDSTTVIIWHMGFALTALAGYTVRLNHEAAQMMAEAQAALARQEIAGERREIARDVHDVVAHTLAVTMLHITAARMAVRRGDSGAAEAALEEAERQGRASLADIRRIVRLLREERTESVTTTQPDLSDIDALIESYRAAGLPVAYSRATNGHRAAPSAELALYRVLREALANAVRHGDGDATVTLEIDGDRLALTVRNPVAPSRIRAANSSGSGLIGMRERISAAGGALDAGYRSGDWIVSAWTPLAREPEPAP